MVESEVRDEREALRSGARIEAVRQVTDRGYPVSDVADRLGVTTHSLYAWRKRFGPNLGKDQELVKTRRLEQVFGIEIHINAARRQRAALLVGMLNRESQLIQGFM
jgi:transposase